jgi:hypothetical protein
MMCLIVVCKKDEGMYGNDVLQDDDDRSSCCCSCEESFGVSKTEEGVIKPTLGGGCLNSCPKPRGVETRL